MVTTPGVVVDTAVAGVVVVVDGDEAAGSTDRVAVHPVARRPPESARKRRREMMITQAGFLGK